MYVFVSDGVFFFLKLKPLLPINVEHELIPLGQGLVHGKLRGFIDDVVDNNKDNTKS